MQSLPVTFKASRLKMALLFFGSGLFVAAGIWILPREPLVGWLAITFFGLCAAVGAIGLHPKSFILQLSAEGFLFVTLFRKHFVPWSSVESFVSIQIGLNKMVGWNYVHGFQGAAGLRRINSVMSGVEAALPDTYGMPVDELCALLSELRARYGQRTA